MNKETMAYKELERSADMEIEDLLGYAADSFITSCKKCAILELCHNQEEYNCSELWAKYLRGEINGEA